MVLFVIAVCYDLCTTFRTILKRMPFCRSFFVASFQVFFQFSNVHNPIPPKKSFVICLLYSTPSIVYSMEKALGRKSLPLY